MSASHDGARPGASPAEAVEELMRRHGGRLYALGLRFCGNEDEARDLVQDTFLLAFRKWGQFEGRSDPATWLYRIAARACQRRHRKRSGEPGVLEPLDALLPSGDEQIVAVSHGASPFELVARREIRDAVEAAVARLPEKFRLPFVLKEMLELSIADVAEALGVKESTVKTRLHRARLHVAKELRRALPKTNAPPAEHARRMCLDLLRMKQDALDRRAPFPVPQAELCARCSSLFNTLDLGNEACRQLAAGELPERVRAEILGAVRG